MRLHNSQDKHEESSTQQGLHTPNRTLPVSLMAVAIAVLLAMALASCGDSSPTPTETPILSDRDALIALYNATNGPSWTNNRNWLSDEPIGEWLGVTTGFSRVVTTGNTGRVSELYLAYNELSGSIPPGISRLTNLLVLRLNGNSLSGEIPSELGNLSKLEVLNLEGNSLSGEIPSELGNLSKLEVLNFGGNSLSGEIPPELGNLSSLTKLVLRSNELTGSFPSNLGKLLNLTYLDVGKTQINGCLPGNWQGRFHFRYYYSDLIIDGSDLGGLPFCE